MQLGLTLRNFAPQDESLEFGDLVGYAQRAEQLGFSSLWVWDHLFLGARNAFPFLESLSVLSALAARTSTVRLGTSVLVLPLRDPVTLAKVTATIDHVSGGRLDLGVASGWYEREFDALGVPFRGRGRLVERNLELLKRFWTEDVVDGTAPGVDGTPDARRFRNVVMLPKPVQQPRPPVLLGGYADAVLRRAATLTDGWLTYLYEPDAFTESWAAVRGHAEAAGRDPATLRNVSQVPICVGDSYEDAERAALAFVGRYMDVPPWSKATAQSAIRGTVEQCAEQIAAHAAAGVQELVLIPANYDSEQVEVIGQELLPRVATLPAGSTANA